MKQINDASPRHEKIKNFINDIIEISPECGEFDYMDIKITKSEYRQIVQALDFYITKQSRSNAE